MSRTFIYGLLQSDAVDSNMAGSLAAMGIGPGSIYAAEAAEDIKVNEFPFLVMRWGTISSGIGPSRRQTLDIWVYDRERDYTRIDDILRRVESLFSRVVAGYDPKGWITQIDWQASSPDLRDDGYDAITRHSTFTVIGSTR